MYRVPTVREKSVKNEKKFKVRESQVPIVFELFLFVNPNAEMVSINSVIPQNL